MSADMPLLQRELAQLPIIRPEGVAGLDVPVLCLIVGRTSTSTPLGRACSRGCCRRPTLLEVPATGHLIRGERAEIFNAAVDDFLQTA